MKMIAYSKKLSKLCLGSGIIFSVATWSAVYAQAENLNYQQLIDEYSQAALADNSTKPSMTSGKELYYKQFSENAKMPSCASCHADDPQQNGRHVITNKKILPISPLVNLKRFTKKAKVEKWFLRNCREVIGRECTAQEKADFILFVSTK